MREMIIEELERSAAIIMGGKGTAADKFAALEAAGCSIVRSPADIGAAMKKFFS